MVLSLSLFILGFMVVPSVFATQPTSVSLNTGWQFRALPNSGHPDVEQWHPAEVPGVTHLDLLRNKLIPDPFYRTNEADLQWIGLTDWEYQKDFTVDQSTLQRRNVELVLAGLDTYADVYLNGTVILKADNQFRQWRVAVKNSLHAGPNTLRIVFHSPVKLMMPKVKAMPYRLPTVQQIQQISEEGIATDPYTRKAGYSYGWDWGPRFITEGIWQPVQLVAWDDIRIDNFHIFQKRVSKEDADVAAEFDIVSSGRNEVTMAVQYDAGGRSTPATSQTWRLENGMNHISLPFRITAPSLWYPNGYGSQAMYRFSATASSASHSEDQAELRTGLRSIELRREPDQWGKSFTFVVNGIPIFAKGADVIPFDSFAPRVTREQHRKILQSAKDAHMNMIRHWGGGYYESDDFYELCDEMGIMVWQDFMFGGAMVPGDTAFQDNVREEITQQIKRLREHPSIALWSGNNELETGWVHWGDRQAFKESVSPAEREKVWQDYVVLFHDIIKSVAKEYGAPVPYWPSSPSANFEEEPDNQHNGDMHYWAVWHAVAPIEEYTHQFPRFMSEYGFQSFPEMRTIRQFAETQDMDLMSPVMQGHQKNVGGNERIRAYMLREFNEPKDFESFIYVSQVLQAEAIKVGAEHLRRQRPRTMGSLYWQLNDCWPVASWSSIDYYGRWKALQYYARRFYDDVLVSPWEEKGTITVSVVSDRQQATPADLRVRLIDFSGKSLYDKKEIIQIPALSSRVYLTLTRKELLRGVDAKDVVAVFEVIQDGKVISRNLHYFDRVRNLSLPKPQIQPDLSGGNGEYTLRLQSPVIARDVYVSLGELDATYSDNYFDLLPNEPATIQIKSGASLDQLRQALNIREITGAFPNRGQ
jgi:beta-mannosidase